MKLLSGLQFPPPGDSIVSPALDKSLRVSQFSFTSEYYSSETFHYNIFRDAAAATAAKSLQSCPTLYDPIDGSPPGSPVPGILQARTLEWVAISFPSE